MSDLFSLFVAHLVQVSVIAFAVVISVRIWGSNRPHLAHILWALVLIKCVTPPVFSSYLSPFSWASAQPSMQTVSAGGAFAQPTPSYSDTEMRSGGTVVRVKGLSPWRKDNMNIGSQQPVAVEPNRNLAEPASQISWQARILVGWALSALLLMLRQCWLLLRLKLQLRSSHWPVELKLQRQLEQLSKRLSLKRTVRLQMTSAAIGPAVVGLFKPTIILPKAIVDGSSSDDLEPLLAHELIHIRRGDLWWALLQAIAGSLFWFHPLVRYAVSSLSRESERSCDEETVASLKCAPVHYARCLIQVLEQKQSLWSVPAVPGVKPIEITSARLERVMKFGNGIHCRTPWWIWGVLVVCCVVALPGAALVFAQEEVPTVDGALLPMLAGGPEKIPENALVTMSYSVTDIIDDLGERNPEAEIQEIELKLLSHLKPQTNSLQRSGDRLRIDKQLTKVSDGRVIAVRTKEGHKAFEQKLADIRDNGLRLIVIEARFLTCKEGVLEDFNWEKVDSGTHVSKTGQFVRKKSFDDAVVKAAANVDSKAPSQHEVDFVKTANFFAETPSPEVDVELRNCVESKYEVSRAMLDDETLRELVGVSDRQTNSVVTETPTMVIRSGDNGSINDTQGRSFVTGVRRLTAQDGTRVHQPLLSAINDGTVVKIFAKAVGRDRIDIDAEVLMSEVSKVETFTFSGTGTQAVSIQLPTVKVSQFKVSGEFSDGKTIAFRNALPKIEGLHCALLLTPHLVDDSRLESKNYVGDTMRRVSDYAPRHERTDVVAVSVSQDEIRKREAVTYYLSDDIQYYTKGDEKLKTADHWLKPQRWQNRFDLACCKSNVVASSAEVEERIKAKADALGMTAGRWMKLVCGDRNLSEKYVRSAISNELRYERLPQPFQEEFGKDLYRVKVDGIIIQSENETKNWDRAQLFENGSLDRRVIVRTEVNVSLMPDGTKFSGNDLEVVSAGGQEIASANQIDFTISKDGMRIDAKGKVTMDLFEAIIMAHEVSYCDEESGCRLNAAGNVRMKSNDYEISAEKVEFGETKVRLHGNAKLTVLSGDKEEFAGESVELIEGQKLVIDGVDTGEFPF